MLKLKQHRDNLLFKGRNNRNCEVTNCWLKKDITNFLQGKQQRPPKQAENIYFREMVTIHIAAEYDYCFISERII